MSETKRRIRRTAEEARRHILDTAEARLGHAGPAGLRLHDIAQEAGVSHPTILHHFGSREGLVKALNERTVNQLRETLLQTLQTPDFRTETMIDEVFGAFRRGLAQRLAFLAVGNMSEDPERTVILRDLVNAVHAMREAAAAPGRRILREDTEGIIHLLTVAAFGDAIFGDLLRQGSSCGERMETARFIRWLTSLVQERLTRGTIFEREPASGD